MTEHKTHSENGGDLRRLAEKIASEKATLIPQVEETLSSEEIIGKLHELRIHQIELELQNEELRRTQVELEKARERYFALYDLAPVGYITLSEKGLIVEANLTAAKLLGLARRGLVKKMLSHFILKEDEDIFYLFRRKIFETGTPQGCELHMLKKGVPEFWAHLDASLAQDDNGLPYCRMVLSDITDRKRSEAALYETRAILESAMDNSQVGFAIADAPSGNLRYVNDAGLLMRGGDRRSLVNGVGIDQYVASWQLFNLDGSPLKTDQVPITRAILYGETCSREFVIRRTQEDDRIVAANATPIRDGQGKVVAGVVAFMDITERIQAEKVISESERKLKTLFEYLPVGVSVIDAEGQVSYVNPALEKILVIPKGGLALGDYRQRAYLRSDGSLMPPDEFASSRALREQRPIYDIETGVVLENGQVVWTSVSTIPVAFADWRIIITTTDITERKQAQEKVSQLAAIVKYSDDMIIGKTLDGIITSWNQSAAEIYGYREAEIIGKPISILAPPEREDEVPEILDKIKQGIPVTHFETVRQKKDGQHIAVSLTISPVRNTEGQIIAVSTIGRDISERKRAEEEIQQLNARLECLAYTDYLTNLYNRRFFMERGSEECKRANRYHHPLTFLMLDIDDFKKINDTYGHEAGDVTLQQIAATLKASLREIDIVGRLGGDEFGVLMADTTLEDGVLLAERIRQSIATLSFQMQNGLWIRDITLSVGAASYTEGMSGIDDLIRNGDAALYGAKNNGRNRVGVYNEDNESFG